MGLMDRRRGRASGKRVPVDRAEEVEALYRERCPGFTVKHFHEHPVKDHGFGSIHLRGLHYRFVARGDVLKPDGKPYVNDDANWTWLSEIAAKAARWFLCPKRLGRRWR